MEVFPTLQTSRLLLRKINVDDIPFLVKYANNRKVTEWVLNIPYPYEEPDAVFRISYVVQGFKAKSRYVFAIVLKDLDEFIGEVSLHLDNQGGWAQLGYWIGEPFWNRGIVTEAVGAILQFGFDRIKLDKIFATCHERNEASAKVMVKNGFQNSNTNGGVRQYWMTKEEYRANKEG